MSQSAVSVGLWACIKHLDYNKQPQVKWSRIFTPDRTSSIQNAASGITNFLPMYWTKISLFCGLSSAASLLRLYTSFLPVPLLNPNHIPQSTPDSHTSSKMLSPHLVHLALTAPPFPGSDSSSLLLLSVSSTACALSPPSPSAAPCLGKQQLCWKHGRTISFLLPPICLRAQYSSGDRCRDIKASSALKYSTLKCYLTSSYYVRTKWEISRVYILTGYGQVLLQMTRQIPNIGAILQPNFKYSPPNVNKMVNKVLRRYSNETADLFFKKVQKCRVFYVVLKTTWIIHAET